METSLIVYKNEWIIDSIYEVSDRIRGEIVDQTLFEARAIKRIGEYILKDPDNLKNRRYIIRMINQVAKSVLDIYRNEHAEFFSSLSVDDDDGEEMEFEPTDVLANVESEVITKETADLLAQGDRRNKEILGYWMIGNKNNAKISRLLAQSVGGNAESHRRYISRFRESCRVQMTAV